MRGLFDDNNQLPSRAEAINANRFLPYLQKSAKNEDLGYVIEDKQYEMLCFYRGQVLRYKDCVSEPFSLQRKLRFACLKPIAKT